MSITEFLLARIAEDEADAINRVVLRTEDRRSLTAYDAEKMHSECAAKRAIVEAHEAYAQESIESTGIAFVGARVGQQVTGDILRALAAVYADHPLYRDEWKVGA